MVDLLELYGENELDRLEKYFGQTGAPGSKPVKENFQLLWSETKLPGTKLGGVSKAIKDYVRVCHIRLEFLRFTVDQGLKHHEARGKLAIEFGISKIRIRQLTRLNK